MALREYRSPEAFRMALEQRIRGSVLVVDRETLERARGHRHCSEAPRIVDPREASVQAHRVGACRPVLVTEGFLAA